MDLPSHLLNTYLTYKVQERDLLRWVCANSTLCHAPTTQSMSKFRTSATKSNKDKYRYSDIETSGSTTNKKVEKLPSIDLLDLVPHAQNIAHNPLIKNVPETVATRFRSVLELRRKCLSWFRQNTAQTDLQTRKETEKHTYPILILVKAVQILEIKFPIPCRKHDGPGEARVAFVHSVWNANPYEALSVEEESAVTTQLDHAESHNVPSTKQGTNPALASVQTARVDGRRYDEWILARFCLLEDLQAIEDFILLEFVRYSLDQANRNTLVDITNCALDLSIQMENSLKARLDPEGVMEREFVKQMMRNAGYSIYSSSLLRLQSSYLSFGFTGFSKSRVAESSIAKEFDPRDEYLGASPEQQYMIELSFIQNFSNIGPVFDRFQYNPFFMDNTTRIISSMMSFPKLEEDFKGIRLSCAFGLKIALLSQIIIRDTCKTEFARFRDEAVAMSNLESKRQKFYQRPANCSRRIQLYNQQFAIRLKRNISIYNEFQPLIEGSLQPSFASNPLLCIINDTQIQMNIVRDSLIAIDFSRVPQLLLQLSNLLIEEKISNTYWLDTDLLTLVVGEKFIYQGTRPVNRVAPSNAIHEQILLGLGLRSKEVKKILYGPDLLNGFLFKSRNKPRFESAIFALYTRLSQRHERLLNESEFFLEDAELILTATEIPKILGKPTTDITIGCDLTLLNRADLWNSVNKGPGLQPLQLLAVSKRRLQKETALINFNFIAFETACAVLVHELYNGFGNLRHTPFENFTEHQNGVVFEELQFLKFNLIRYPNKAKLVRIAQIFDSWLAKYGAIGIASIPKPDSGSIRPLPTKPGIVKAVGEAVKRSGLIQGTFTTE